MSIKHRTHLHMYDGDDDDDDDVESRADGVRFLIYLHNKHICFDTFCSRASLLLHKDRWSMPVVEHDDFLPPVFSAGSADRWYEINSNRYTQFLPFIHSGEVQLLRWYSWSMTAHYFSVNRHWCSLLIQNAEQNSNEISKDARSINVWLSLHSVQNIIVRTHRSKIISCVRFIRVRNEMCKSNLERRKEKAWEQGQLFMLDSPLTSHW